MTCMMQNMFPGLDLSCTDHAQHAITSCQDLDDLYVNYLSVDDLPLDDLSVDALSVDDLSVDDLPLDDLLVDYLSVDHLSVNVCKTCGNQRGFLLKARATEYLYMRYRHSDPTYMSAVLAVVVAFFVLAASHDKGPKAYTIVLPYEAALCE